MTLSNYTAKIETINPAYNAYFMKSEQSKKVFVAGKMIEKDLLGCKMPDVDMSKNEYYSLGLIRPFYSDVMYNIDIKSAYATILYNDGYLSGKTFKYINKLDKQERLAALGMIASKKEIFEYSRSGRVTKHEEVINPLSPFFYYCVQKTNDIILDLKNKIMMNSFIFSWVDGIYYNDNSCTNVAKEYLNDEYRLNSTTKELTEFEAEKKEQFFDITFMDNGVKKEFAVPIPESNLKRKIISHLLNKDYE